MAKAIMVQGTASSSGKSLTVTGLCRIFRQDGFGVAPFKSQNMALNSFITRDGLEMGRAQAIQAEAAGVEPSVLMNPLLLKPTGDAASQVIVNGVSTATMKASEYFRRKNDFIPVVRQAYRTLSERHDIIVLEGAGSPAEINLRDNDIVNMGMAALADSPVLLVGDIDRGGVFASLYGTVELLPPEERSRIKGIVINKFRGDAALLRPGLRQLETLTGVPVVGVVPWLSLDIDDEDGASAGFTAERGPKPVDVAIVHLPRIANFTDFTALERHPAIGVRYVRKLHELGRPDLVIIPGTQSPIGDLFWMRRSGLEAGLKKLVEGGMPLLGLGGGCCMLGFDLDDAESPEHVGRVRGMELLPITAGQDMPATRRVTGRIGTPEGFFSCLADAAFEGYAMRTGGARAADFPSFAMVDDGSARQSDGAVSGNVAGTCIHGLFDGEDIVQRLAGALLAGKGIDPDAVPALDPRRHREAQYDKLAAALRAALDLQAIYGIIGIAKQF